MENHIDQLTPIALVTMVALLCGLAFIRMRQPAIVGYILAGIVLGPTGFQIIEQTESVQILAELGVIMLLFLIGIELSLRGFRSIYKTAMLTALLQIFLFTALFLGVGEFLEWPIERVLIFGFSLALSSTAVSIKILEESGDLKTPIGRLTVSILIAQDLVVIPMLLIINAFGGQETTIDYTIVIKLFAAVGGLSWLIWILSRRERLQLPFFEWVRNRRDIMPLAALASCFTMATISGVMGLSTAYGAFIAGLVLGNSNMRAAMHQATEPIQTILLMVFFLSIGLLIDLDFILDNSGLVLLTLFMVTFVKTMINIAILRFLGKPWPMAFQTGVVLGQVGEFSFILIAAGLTLGIINPEGYRLLISVIALSLMISPIWLAIARRIHNIAEKNISGFREFVKAAIAVEKK